MWAFSSASNSVTVDTNDFRNPLLAIPREHYNLSFLQHGKYVQMTS